MTIKSIKYKNYRCFKDVSINFDTKPGKNIFMVVAPNGGGKTEMLFSFQWVLYGFDFSKLNAKESTPYSLNSTLHQNLQDGYAGEKNDCSVELTFEANGRTYTIKRTEVFTRKFKSTDVWSEQHVELSSTNEAGVKSLCERDPEKVREYLSRIIPSNILQGIIFDGERMKRLSQLNDESKEAVEGVIKQITNEDLFERCRTELKSISKDTSKATKSLSSKTGISSISHIENELQEKEDLVGIKDIELRTYKLEQKQLIEDLEEIHLGLSEIEESRAFEEKRTALRAELQAKENELNKQFEFLYEDLDDGYLLISDKLFDDVDNLLKDYDIPAGLTVSAVRNILERPTCICGHPFTQEERDRLEELISKLPPDNINSAIGEMVRNARLQKKSLSDTLCRTYRQISELEKEINGIKETLPNISAQISDGASDKIKLLEEENTKKTKRLGVVEEMIASLDSAISLLKREITGLKKEREEAAKLSSQLMILCEKQKFIDKCLTALDAIAEYNKNNSLHSINLRINDAYKLLSEDYEKGRRLYIIQFDKKAKYRMVSYLEDKYQQRIKKLTGGNGLEAHLGAGETLEGLQEKAIIKVSESNSTGQAKVNSLAFAKAILDYSRADRSEKSFEISRSYPFLIDSPFTELSDGNLIQSADNIHLFAEQIILMISQESLRSVQDRVMPYVGAIAELEKSKNDSFSTLKK